MPRRLQVTEVNPHVICTLCDGYLVDATAIIECLHAFCRTCIVRYLENSKFCPVCDVQVHKTKPLQSIRSDQTLQDLVYKMVPDLYQNEMQRRRDFYAEHPKAAWDRSPEERGEGEQRFFSPKESISLSLHHLKSKESKCVQTPSQKDPMTRHLNCPAAFTVGHLKKFIHLKFSLPPTCEVDVFYDDHVLRDNFTLMDVAYIYSWKRAEPMKFSYSIAKRVPRSLEPPPPPPSETETVVDDDKVATEDVPEVPPVVTEVECMDVDSQSSVVEVEDAAEAKADAPELDSTSSKDDVRKEDVPEPKHSFHSSLPIKSTLTLAPLVPEPTYNSVKVVSAPEPNTLLSPTNGFRLKFIHDPELNPKKSSSKKSGRKGRSSRHKSAPVRLARLAPYPPPAACLTTPQHLSQLTVGKLVPSVITTLAPTFVTTLVSTTSNSVCTNGPGVSNFLGQSSAVCTITTPNTLLTSPVLPSTAVTLSSTASTVTVSARSQQNSPVPTKELLSADTTPTDVETSTANTSSAHSSALTNSVEHTNLNVPDSSLSPSPAVVSSSTKDVDGSEVVTSTSGDPVPTPLTDSDVTCHSQGSTPIPATSIGEDIGFGSPSLSGDDPKESAASKLFPDTSSDLPSTKESDKQSEPFSSCNGHGAKGGLSPKESTLAVDNKNSHDSFKSMVAGERSTLEAMVKDTISAEFSDNDDLGCQSDLVVDEQKAGDSSENDEEDALRKKINAIAEKEDETDEADSGRASDMSCPARGDEDMGSPVANDVATHHAKSSNIDHVIKQIYLQHEIGRSSASPKPAQRDDLGALDLSTCTRKPGEQPPSRPRAVANPVLDIKHRQQTYLPAPVRQHTACVPTPKHPTSSPLLMHQLTSHPSGSILQAQLTGKSHHHHHHPVPYPLPNLNRGVSSPPSYSYRFAHQQAAANLLAGMMPYATPGCLTGFAPRPHLKDVSSPPCTKMSSSRDRKNWSSVSSSRKMSETLLSGGPNCRVSAAMTTSPTGIPAHPRTSPSILRMSPHHRSASPAPHSNSPTTTAAMTTSSSSSSQSKQSVPIYKKSDSFKGFNKFKRSANLAVFNPDPNGYRQKLVIKNLDFRSSNHHHH